MIPMNEGAHVYQQKPKDFNPKVQVAAVYVNVDGKLLILELSPNKQEKGAWGVPAGKSEMGEMLVQTAKRELFEETGIDIESESAFRSFGELYIRKPDLDYVYHLFAIHLDSQPSIQLSLEHSSYRWVSRQEVESLPLMVGERPALLAYYEGVRK